MILNASTEANFIMALDSFKTPGRHPKDAVDYAVMTWIEPWKVSSIEIFHYN